MTRGIGLWMAFGLMACTSAIESAPLESASAEAPPSPCGAVQRELAAVAPSAEVSSCAVERAGQVVESATIAIDGRDAAALERHLQQRYGLAPLSFACCGWESHPVEKATAPDGTVVMVSMFSDETVETDRGAWPSLRFRVLVERVDV